MNARGYRTPPAVRDVATDLELVILQRALDALQEATGLDARLGVEPKPAEPAAGPVIDRIDIHDGERRFVLRALVRTRVDRPAALAAAHAEIRKIAGDQGVLVTPYLTKRLAEHCRNDLQLQFLDAAGNAYLRQPGLHVLVAGQPRPEMAVELARTNAGGTPTALRVVFLFLCRPELLNAPYRDIAGAAGVALGAVGPVLHDLAARHFIIGAPGQRTLVEPVRLFDEWVMNYATRLRPKLNARRFTAADPRWWEGVDLHGLDACWGGEVAVDRLTRQLKPGTFTIYVQTGAAKALLGAIAPRYGLRADPRGNIEILDAFWTLPTDPRWRDVAPRPLVYADLVATLDPRNLEAAGVIRKQYLDDTFGQA